MASGAALWSTRYSVISLTGGAASGVERKWTLLSLQVPRQEQDNWCWAATSVGVARFYDSDSRWTQCRIVNRDLDRDDCCADGAGGPCDVYGYLERALGTVGHLERMTTGAAGPKQVASDIEARRPIGARVAWSGGGAHFLALGGWRELPEPYVHVEDPWYGSSDVPYATLVNGYQGSGSWTHSYWTRRHRARV